MQEENILGNMDLDWTDCEDEYSLSSKLFGRMELVLKEHEKRLKVLSRNLRIYSNVDAVADDIGYSNCRLLQMSGVNGDSDDINEDNTHSYNVIRVCVNTLANKIGKGVVNPRIMSTGANFYVREKCKMADSFIKSAFHKMKFHEEARKILFDACLQGTGVGKVCVDSENNEIWVERVMLDEVFVELHDAYYGDPSRIYQLKFMSRKTLQKKFPEQSVLIAASSSLPFDAFTLSEMANESLSSENIVVIEAWAKQGDGVNGKGRHVLATSNAILFDEEWDKDYLPFIKLDYTPPLVGWYGEGIAHEILKLQQDLTDIDQYIDEAIHAVTAPKIFYNEEAEFSKGLYDNVVGGLIGVKGLAKNVSPASVIHTISPTALSNEVYSYRQGKLKDAHDQCGVSQMSASGMKPAGLDSGAALREYNDIQSERFATFGFAYENFTKDAASIVLKELVNLSDYVVRNRKGTGLKKIKFSDLGLALDDIEVDVYPVSALPDSPAGRLASIKELGDVVAIPPNKIPELLRMPDLEGFFEIEDAPKRYIDKFLSRLLKNPKNGVFEVDPMMDLEYLHKQCVKYYNYICCDLEDSLEEEGDDEEAINTAELLKEKLFDLAETAKALIAETQPPPQPQIQGPAMGAPMPPMDPMMPQEGMLPQPAAEGMPAVPPMPPM